MVKIIMDRRLLRFLKIGICLPGLIQIEFLTSVGIVLIQESI